MCARTIDFGARASVRANVLGIILIWIETSVSLIASHYLLPLRAFYSDKMEQQKNNFQLEYVCVSIRYIRLNGLCVVTYRNEHSVICDNEVFIITIINLKFQTKTNIFYDNKFVCALFITIDICIDTAVRRAIFKIP